MRAPTRRILVAAAAFLLLAPLSASTRVAPGGQDVAGTFELSVTAPGGTDLHYVRDAEGATSVDGEFEGDPVAEEEPAA